MMNCQEVESRILEYCDAPASSELHNQVSLHLQRCESCRNNYKLTRAESEILSESGDIPALSPGFTTSVIGAIKQNHKLYPQSPIEMIKEQPAESKHKPSVRIWGSMAAAAIIGLGIYTASSYVPFKNVSMVDTPAINEEASPTGSAYLDTAVIKQSADTLGGTGPTGTAVNPVDESKTALVDTLAATPRLLSTQTGQEASRQTITSISLPDAVKETNYTLNDIFIANVPEQFGLTKINKLSESLAEYNYSNSDGTQHLTVSVNLVPLAGSSDPVNAKINQFTSVGTQKVILGFTGDLPDQLLEKMADNIRVNIIKP